MSVPTGATPALSDEARFRRMIDAVSDHAISLIDPGGRVQTWAPAAERMTQYRAEEVVGQHFRVFFTPEDQRAGTPDALLARVASDGCATAEGWRRRKDDSRFWAAISLHQVRGEDGSVIGYTEVVRDMTEANAAQASQLENERRFRLLVEGVVDYAIYMLDGNGTIVNWNRGAERIKGWTAAEIVGRHFSVFYTPEDRRSGAPARALEHALKEGRYESEGWRLRKNGERFWTSAVLDAIFDDDGRHIGFAKITRDISERKAAQEALAQSERQFRLLVSGVTDSAMFMLDPNGTVSNWNAGAQRIKGYSAPEIIGRHFSVFYTDSDREAGLPRTALQRALTQGRFESEGWRVRKDGNLFWASVVIEPIRDEDGSLAGFAKITRDISDRRRTQQELHKAHERLAQAQKIEALGQLTGGVAHDFNNLLMVVSGQALLMRMVIGEDPRTQKALDAIDKAVKRGEKLTRQLLSFARRQRLQPEPISLAAQVGTFREILVTSLPGNISLVMDLPETLWPVKVDPSEFEVALLNMAVNARDAMPSGGTLSISGRNISLEGGEVDPELKGEFVALTVQDTGVGIPPDIVPRVFDPFFTTKDVSKGTGLGLSQVYGFVQQSGGQVVLRSELGQGTGLTLYLPRADSLPVAAPASSPQREALAAKGASILVVEDNPLVADVAVSLFDQLGHHTQVVSSADAALEALKDGPLPDLVFSDIVMAGEMDGVALGRQIRVRHPGLPVLLATGYSRSAEQIGDEFPLLRKPYQFVELGRAVSALLAARKESATAKVLPFDGGKRSGRRQG